MHEFFGAAAVLDQAEKATTRYWVHRDQNCYQRVPAPRYYRSGRRRVKRGDSHG